MKRKLTVILFAIIIAAVCISVFTACASGNKDYAPGGGGVNEDNADKAETVVGNVNRKIFYRVYLELTGEKPEKIGERVRTETTKIGGYIESSSESYYSGDISYYRYTVRIPTEKLDEFLATVEGEGKVGEKRIDAVDITTGYVNAQTRKEALESERAVLDGLMHKDGVTVTDVLTISKRISEINAELNSLEIQINDYDSLIDYSTVNIYISEPDKVPVAAIVVPIVLALVIIGAVVAVVVVNKRKKALLKAATKE